MKKLVFDIINKLNLPKIEFADVRLTSQDREYIYFENGGFKSISKNFDDNSLGVRVLINGTWGFAGTNKFDKYSLEKTIKRAINNAEVGSTFRRNKIKLSKNKALTGSYFFKPEKDPFLMKDEEKINYLGKIAKKLTSNDKIVHSYVYSEFFRQYKIYANTENSFVDSLIYDTKPVFNVLSSDGNHVYSRTFPGHMSGRRAGFEALEKMDFETNSEIVIKEAIDLLKAPAVNEDKADIIIGGGHLALQLHESVGHATEADRIFGKEISYAGKTFIKPEMLGNFQYGSDIVNIYSDSTDKRGMGFHLVDDEGIEGKKVDIIKNGILTDQQTSREIAPLLGLTPSSNMIAVTGDNFPLVRMTNFCLAPGKGSLKDLISETENGYLVDNTKTWSIDDNRNNFQFTTEIGWKIKNGEIVGIVKEPTYFGITKDFWNSCDRICGEEEWQYHGTFECGKGEPGQALHLSHGVAPARFRNIAMNAKA